MNRINATVGFLFLGLGLALFLSGMAFPQGIGGLPGAGFFPQVIGCLITLLACALLYEARTPDGESGFKISNPRQVLGIAALLFVYLLLWGSGYFILRTIVFLIPALRFLKQDWRASLGYSVALTLLVYLAFDTGLNITLE